MKFTDFSEADNLQNIKEIDICCNTRFIQFPNFYFLIEKNAKQFKYRI